MNIRVVLLSVLVAASSASAWYLSRNEQSVVATPSSSVLDGLAQQSDAIEYVKIESATKVVFEAKRDEGKWQATHLDSAQRFPVDTKALSTLIRKLAQATIVEKKTENEKLYPRLGVEDPKRDGAESMLLTLEDAEQQWQLIAGNVSKSRRGQFIRHPDQSASYLIDKTVSLPLSSAEWLNKRILPATMQELNEARFWQPEKQELVISQSSDESLQWQAGSVEGEQVQTFPASSLSYPGILAQALEDIFAFNYLQVAPFSQADWETQTLAGKVDMTLLDGERILVEISAANELDQYQVHFDMPESPSWVSDWVFTVSGYQGRAFLLSSEAITGAAGQ